MLGTGVAWTRPPSDTLLKPFGPCHCPTVDALKKVVNKGHRMRCLTELITMPHCVVAAHELVCDEEISTERQRWGGRANVVSFGSSLIPPCDLTAIV